VYNVNKLKYININIIKGGGKGAFNFCINCLWILFFSI